jgi:hypothetical protein
VHESSCTERGVGVGLVVITAAYLTLGLMGLVGIWVAMGQATLQGFCALRGRPNTPVRRQALQLPVGACSEVLESVVPALGPAVGPDCWSSPATVAWVVEVGKDCGDPAAEFAFFGQFKFREDGIDVLLDRGWTS